MEGRGRRLIVAAIGLAIMYCGFAFGSMGFGLIGFVALALALVRAYSHRVRNPFCRPPVVLRRLLFSEAPIPIRTAGTAHIAPRTHFAPQLRTARQLRQQMCGAVQPVSSGTHTVIDCSIVAVVAAVAGFSGLDLISFVVLGLIITAALTVRFFWASGTDGSFTAQVAQCDGRQFRIGPFVYAGVFFVARIVPSHMGHAYDYVVAKLDNPDPPFVLGLTATAFIFFIVVGYQLDSGMPTELPPRVYPRALPTQPWQGGNGTTKGKIKKKG
jgi:hypothetical protein